MSDSITLDGITVNAPDALALAEFYAEITGGVARGDSRWAAVAGPHAAWMMRFCSRYAFIAFQQAADFRPPTWPGGSLPMQMHLEFLVEDLGATGARARTAGATLLDFQPNSDHCLVYADPAGHPFCLSLWHGQDLFDSSPDSHPG